MKIQRFVLVAVKGEADDSDNHLAALTDFKDEDLKQTFDDACTDFPNGK